MLNGVRFVPFLLTIFLTTLAAFGSSYGQRINPETDITYLGAFRLPSEYSNNHQWEYGGYALAFRPDGDPGGDQDGFYGSLYSVGKRRGADERKCVSEFSIPKPIKSNILNELPIAKTLQPFGDITQGFFDQALSGQELNSVRGLVYLDYQYDQGGGKIYWSIWSAYNVGGVDLPSQGYSGPSISNANAQGVWKLKGHHSKSVSGYLFAIPKEWADEYLNGMYIATGISRAGGAYSRGPVLFAIAPYKYSNINPPPNNELPTIPLISYSSDHDNYPNYVPVDEWLGGAWLTAGNKEAVIFVGLKCLGASCYGTGEHCGDSCNDNKGYHCFPREPEMVFYDVTDLEQVATGAKQPWDPQPYYELDLSKLIPKYGKCTQTQGVAYDREHNLLYLIQYKGDGAKPLVHVLKINDTSSSTTMGQAPGTPPYLRIIE